MPRKAATKTNTQNALEALADNIWQALHTVESSDEEIDAEQVEAATPPATTAHPAHAADTPHQSQTAVHGKAGENGKDGNEGESSEEEDDFRNLQWNPQVHIQPAQATGSMGVELQKEATLTKEERVVPRDRRVMQRMAAASKQDTAGRGWFDLPATPLTDDIKRDLRLLKLRSAFDPKRHYKSLDQGGKKGHPKYFQIGTVVEGPGEFFTGRLSKKERKNTLTEQLLADQELTTHRKKKYAELQAESEKWTRGKKKKTTAKARR